MTLAVWLGLAGAPGTAWAAGSDPSAKLQQVQREIEAKRAALRRVTAAERATQQRLRSIKAQLAQTSRQLQQLQSQVRNKRTQLIRTEQQLTATQAKYNQLLASLEARLRRIYMSGSYDALTFLLSGATVGDYLSHWEFLRRIAQEDRRLLAETAATKARIAELKEQLARQKAQLEGQAAKTAQVHAQYSRQRASQEAVLEGIQSEKAAYERSLRELEEESRRIEREIRLRQARGRLTTPAGEFRWPLSARLTSGYGMRTHPIFGVRRMHTGIDLAAPTGTAVRAAADGEVLFVGPRGGYGLVVILDHGGYISTLYAHLSAILVKEGQRVLAGDVVGRVGSTGNATGPHLHFEVRRRGAPVNPLSYLASS